MATKSVARTKREQDAAVHAVWLNRSQLQIEWVDFKDASGTRFRVVDVLGAELWTHTAIVQVAHEDWGTVPYFVAMSWNKDGIQKPYLVVPRTIQTTVWDKVK